jgi:subtilisin-like proprotein convertase family protein
MNGRRDVGVRRKRNGNEEASGRWRLSLGDLVEDSEGSFEPAHLRKGIERSAMKVETENGRGMGEGGA